MTPRAGRWTCPGQPIARSPWASSLAGRRRKRRQRTVGAAKSWLCHSRVDRRQPILPWNAPEDVAKISPVTAARHYLEHLVAAWEAEFPDAPVAEQQVVLTVPASFDAAARELTREAALAAGLPARSDPAGRTAGSRLRLAGRARRSLAQAAQGGRPAAGLRRGRRHDRPDADRGRPKRTANWCCSAWRSATTCWSAATTWTWPWPTTWRERFATEGVKLDPWQTGVAVALLPHGQGNSARTGRPRHAFHLGPGTRQPADRRHGVGGSGSGGPLPSCWSTVSFPHATWHDRPQARRVSGFQEIGLPFESDTAVTRTWPRFWRPTAERIGPRPAHARAVQRRRVQGRCICSSGCWRCLGSWAEQQAPPQIAGRRARPGPRGGPRRRLLRLGQATTAACGFAAAWPAATTWASRRPDWPFPAPRGRCERCASSLSAWKKEPKSTCPRAKSAWCWANRPISASSARPFAKTIDRARARSLGAKTSWSKPIRWKPRCRADASIDEPYVPVRFQSRITELGTFELWCVSTQTDGRWKLEFSVRDDDGD